MWWLSYGVPLLDEGAYFNVETQQGRRLLEECVYLWAAAY